jgi:hypothetical protein
MWGVSRRAAPGDRCERKLLRRGRRRCCRRWTAGRARRPSGRHALAQCRGPRPAGKEGPRGSKRRSDGHGRRITGGRKVRSKIRWFTEFCNSHYVSHFAAFFIDARAKRSVAKSFYSFKFSSSEGARSVSERFAQGPAAGGPPRQREGIGFAGLAEPRHSGHSVMIPPLVHQRRPCYDFYFL